MACSGLIFCVRYLNLSINNVWLEQDSNVKVMLQRILLLISTFNLHFAYITVEFGMSRNDKGETPKIFAACELMTEHLQPQKL